MEDLKLSCDGTVRNTIGTVVQFKYGEDGIDPAHAIGGKAIDLDDLFYQVLGNKAENNLNVDAEGPREDYGSLDRDLVWFSNEEDDENNGTLDDGFQNEEGSED